MKERLLRALKRASLTVGEVERVALLLLNIVDSRDRREFREYCRLGAAHGSAALRDGLDARRRSVDEGVRRRARLMWQYASQHGKHAA